MFRCSPARAISVCHPKRWSGKFRLAQIRRSSSCASPYTCTCPSSAVSGVKLSAGGEVLGRAPKKSATLQEPSRGEAVDVPVTLHVHSRPSVVDRNDEYDLTQAQAADDIELGARAFAQA